jgi:hypothetical protein
MFHAWNMEQHLTLLNLDILFTIQNALLQIHILQRIYLFPGLNIAAYCVFKSVKFMPLCPIDVYI